MPLVIPDDILKQAGLTEREARIEFACRLFAAGRLSKAAAAQFCALDRVAFESELAKRGIDIFRYGPDDLKQDLQTLDRALGKP
jgi:predicted HTH domain antitoxin